MKRFWKFKDTPGALWRDWKWQIANRLDNFSDIRSFFPALTVPELDAFHAYTSRFSFAITPFLLSLLSLDASGNPDAGCPLYRQFRYLRNDEFAPDPLPGGCLYDGVNENWEDPREFPTRILHHKYPGRAIIRLTGSCMGYCNYCYLTARVLDRNSGAGAPADQSEWEKTLDYLKRSPGITDVLISGGEPLMLDNPALEQYFSGLRSVSSVRTLRLNTRALTFNPFRFDAGLLAVFKKYGLTALEIHLSHPREITPEMDDALRAIDGSGHSPLLLWRAPLLRGVNDSKETLTELFLKLYERRILPYYLFHCAPYTLARKVSGVGVAKGAALLSEIRRLVPGPAFPRYTLFHIEGKQDIPLEPEGTPGFQYIMGAGGSKLVRFLNWKGRWVEYPDTED